MSSSHVYIRWWITCSPAGGDYIASVQVSRIWNFWHWLDWVTWAVLYMLTLRLSSTFALTYYRNVIFFSLSLLLIRPPEMTSILTQNISLFTQIYLNIYCSASLLLLLWGLIFLLDLCLCFYRFVSMIPYVQHFMCYSLRKNRRKDEALFFWIHIFGYFYGMFKTCYIIY
jgi:hypothetical protein